MENEMTEPINHDSRTLVRVAQNEKPLSLELRLPSPQCGRGAGAEGEHHGVVGCLPLRIQPASPAFIAQLLPRQNPPHPQPFSRIGERGAEFSILSLFQEGLRSLSSRSQKFGAKILVACLWILFFAATPGVLAQVKKADQSAEQPASTKPRATAERQQDVRKVFVIKHADVNAIASTLNIFTVSVQPNRELRVIGVSAPAALMATIEETIRRLDVPAPAPQNVELTVYLLLASDQEGSVAPELDSVVKQLKTTFGFKGFRAVDTLVVRSRDTRPGHVNGLSRLDPEIPNPSTYSLSYNGASINSDEKGRSIRLNGLRFKANIIAKKQQAESGFHGIYENYDAGFGTDVDVREGQKVVVGKAAIGGTSSALILVITAKVLE
jgi:hypothetical protein